MRNRSTQLLSSIFNTDNWLMRVCEKILDLVTLNLLFLISCLPIVTIGIAKISLYRTLQEVRDGRGVRVIRLYIHTFKAEWKYGLALGGIEILVSIICLMNLLLFRGQTAMVFQGMKMLAFGLFFLMSMVMLYAYPLAARFEQSLQELLQTAFVLAGLHFLWTFAMLGFAALLAFLLIGSSWTIVFGSMFFLLAGFSSLGYLQLGILEPIFRKYDNSPQ
ncbi:YesL family protein [Streptococcus sp. ZJ93]|uniref:YesL family protein n=1 Tax=Streptococcus handemini TaxID=3161188 RepID=UPI0034D78149